MTPTPCSCCNSPTIFSFRGPHHFLSNFYENGQIVHFDSDHPPVLALTLEHAYQACKARRAEDFNWICSAPTPYLAKARGRRVRICDDWDDLRLLVMKSLLLDKFAKGTKLAEMLVNTNGAELVEGNCWGDRFWGVAGGAGQNHLGRLLMEVRGELG